MKTPEEITVMVGTAIDHVRSIGCRCACVVTARQLVDDDEVEVWEVDILHEDGCHIAMLGHAEDN